MPQLSKTRRAIRLYLAATTLILRADPGRAEMFGVLVLVAAALAHTAQAYVVPFACMCRHNPRWRLSRAQACASATASAATSGRRRALGATIPTCCPARATTARNVRACWSHSPVMALRRRRAPLHRRVDCRQRLPLPDLCQRLHAQQGEMLCGAHIARPASPAQAPPSADATATTPIASACPAAPRSSSEIRSIAVRVLPAEHSHRLPSAGSALDHCGVRANGCACEVCNSGYAVAAGTCCPRIDDCSAYNAGPCTCASCNAGFETSAGACCSLRFEQPMSLIPARPGCDAVCLVWRGL